MHASPGRDDGDGLAPEMPDALIQAQLRDCDADLIFVGHTHRSMDRRIGRWHVVNLGSVSNPPTAERRANYVVLTATQTGYTIEHRLVDYDRLAVIKAVKELEHPGASFICKHLGDSESC